MPELLEALVRARVVGVLVRVARHRHLVVRFLDRRGRRGRRDPEAVIERRGRDRSVLGVAARSVLLLVFAVELILSRVEVYRDPRPGRAVVNLVAAALAL